MFSKALQQVALQRVALLWAILGPKTHTKEGQKSLFSKNLQNGLKSSKMVQDIKIAQFNPDFNGICPVL